MTRKRLYLLWSVVVMVSFFVACQPPASADSEADTTANVEANESELASDVELGPMFGDQKATVSASASEAASESVEAENSTPRPEPSKSAKATPAVKKKVPSKTTTETLYVSTYDRGGQVWGHVTMTGDRGKGTIHDAEENHYTVTCTRHGDELYAVDQNSRQYVFKLK